MTGFKSLGFIGLGVMGEGMCGNVVRKASVPVHGTDLDPERLAALAAVGLVPHESIADVAAHAECIFLSLPGGPQVEEVASAILDRPGQARMVVDMSTAPASLARALARRFAEKGIAFVDAPVARLRAAARDGTLSIMVGASQEDFETVRPYLSFMGTDITHCGDVGAGQIVKILNNMVVFMNVHALAEALAIARAHDVDGQKLFDVLAMGSADSFMLRNAGMNSLAVDEFPLGAFPTAYALKDIGYALDLAEDSGLKIDGARATAALLKETGEAGFTKEYYPVFLKTIEKNRK
ncbi:MAG: 2-hydroxy-3-oxopropionate reductase [Alphaproteobacteria bacterium HGW-Alphaproteobacteria-5]|jgi:3-hydroxyisobutyrate dehydrogenase-like beta-hydroxyacid dehydrogenase|nr:MAG: 2-hydroxy-3-oxopropionate reductase [Alphaproteobacteria bacterium HGW-Alphaproteobacteria-5]